MTLSIFFSVIIYLIPSIFLIFLSFSLAYLIRKKILGNKIYNLTTNKTCLEIALTLYFYFLLFGGILCLIVYIFNYLNYNNSVDFLSMVDTNPNINNNNNVGFQDPVRLFSSSYRGVQFGIIGSAVFAYNKVSGPPRVKVVAALSALGVSAGTSLYTIAVDNPVVFNSYMFSLSEYFNRGKWLNLIGRVDLNNSSNNSNVVNPNDVLSNVTSESLNNNTMNNNIELLLKSLDQNKILNLKTEDQQQINNAINELTERLKKSNNKDTFLDDFNIFEYLNSVSDFLLEKIAIFFRFAPVTGQLDDLLGQQLVIFLCLFLIMFSVFVLILIYICLNIVILNQEYLINKFNNKYIKLYIKYQLFLVKISMIHIPITILVGILVILHGLHFLITHSIPYSDLGIDLSTVVSRK